MVRAILSIVSGLIAVGCFIPYGIDIVRGRAKPARSTRLMLSLLIVLALLKQQSIGSGWALALTIGEALGAQGILVLAIWKGRGGLQKVDLICYGLLIIDMLIWKTTHSAFVALHLTVLADTIALWPTLVKTWLEPDSETPLFWVVGAIAPLFALVAEKHLTYGVALFPMYIAAINAVMALLVLRPMLFSKNDILTP